MTEQDGSIVDKDILSYYDGFDEAGRLERLGSGLLEFARMQELISRHLPAPPGVVLDIGGAAGAYSCWLARGGYEAHLIDPVAKHLDQAREASASQPDHPIASVTQGDARNIAWEDAAADAVLLMGPLYHLTSREDRVLALGESRRALKTGGVLFAKAINRFGSLFDGLTRGLIDDPVFIQMLQEDLREGQHRSSLSGYFTTSFFHRPEELESEVLEAGFAIKELVAVQWPGWLAMELLERSSDEGRRGLILDLVRLVEHEPTLLGVSPHFVVIATA